MCTKRVLWMGDAVILFFITYLGFVTHGTQSHLGRWLLTSAVTTAVWYLAATPVGLMEPASALQKRWWLWVVWATFLSVPLALAIRALLLRQAIAPLFPFAAAGFNALAMLLWRGVYTVRCRR